MLAPLFLALLLVPLVEIYVLIQVGEVIGTAPTILLLIFMSIVGAWLLKREGSATWRRLRASMAAGQMPTRELTDGAMILFGGALMLTPGFITDVVGLAMILPPTRAVLKGTFRALLGSWFLGRAGLAGTVGRGIYASKVVRSRRSRAASSTGRPDAAPSALSAERRADEDGSPDRT
ncbi:MAG: FxsA family protein [Actinomycetota bacterium]|nr:FxsA family protein [Actinomycetota bacterium]